MFESCVCSHVMNKTNSTEQKGSPNSHRNSPDRFKVSCLLKQVYMTSVTSPLETMVCALEMALT